VLTQHAAPAVTPRTLLDERAARRTLLDQVARLEEELSQLFCSVWPRKGFDFTVAGRGGPRLLSLGELEELRDELVGRVRHVRRALSDRTYAEEESRRLIEEMLLDPEEYKWVRVSNGDIGEPGCKHWHVRPRWSFIGMLMGWWRVVISSGCPLAEAPGSAGCARTRFPEAPGSAGCARTRFPEAPGSAECARIGLRS
jgi:hypothetical protein